MGLAQPSFIVIPVGGDEHMSRDDVVDSMRSALTFEPFVPALYVVEEPSLVLRIARHLQRGQARPGKEGSCRSRD